MDTVTLVTDARQRFQSLTSSSPERNDTYSTLVLPPPHEAAHVLLVDPSGRPQHVLDGRTYARLPHQIAVSRAGVTADLTSLSEQEGLVVRASPGKPRQTTTAAVVPKTSSRRPACAWCDRRFERVTDMQQCKDCKSILYCNVICGDGHWFSGHREVCVKVQH